MAIWKQLFGIILVACIAGFVVVQYVPGGRAFLTSYGLLPEAPADAMAGATGAQQQQRQGGGQGGGQGAGRPGGRATLVVLGEVTEAVINDRVTALGTGAAVQSATLTPSASGLLTSLHVQSGAQVSVGEVIATLDPASAQVAYDAAKVAYDDARKTLDRFQQIGSSASVSATQLQSYQLAADKAELVLRQAGIDLQNRQIVSPIAGTIGIIQVNPGVEVTQSTVIATVEDNSAIKVIFGLPERLVGRVRTGDAVQAVPVARPELTLDAEITALDNRIDEASGSFEVEARIPNGDHRLTSGMSFTMTMRFAGDSYVAVPPLAVQWGSDGAYVWRAVDQTAQRVAVTVIQRNAENVLVSGDLKAGEQVVTEGLESLRDGMTVTIAGQARPEGSAQVAPEAKGDAPQPLGAAEAGTPKQGSAAPAPTGN